ncbi:thiamine pyrophosphate-dependent enzyme [Tardisphaera saccharovorans]
MSLAGDLSIRTIRETPLEEYLHPGSSMCPGCGAQVMIRLMLKVLGPKTFIVNAAGCMTLLQTYPYSNLKSGWLYTAFASAPAGAQGIRDALDSLISQGKTRDEGIKILVLTGDGGAYDIGLQATSAAMDRDLDFYYLCYDNEAYGNTGFQQSGASPYGSSTTTSPIGRLNLVGTEKRKKNLFEIWKAHNPAYLATISPSHPLDLMQKVEEATRRKGPKMFIGYASCPTGMGFDPSLSIKVAQLAVDTGVWPLKKYVDGKVTHTIIPRFVPVEEYLRLQARFRHLFDENNPAAREAIAKIKDEIRSYWKAQGVEAKARHHIVIADGSCCGSCFSSSLLWFSWGIPSGKGKPSSLHTNIEVAML